MAASTQRHGFPLGSVLFSLSLVALFGYYAHDVHAAARGVTDWLLIVPAAGIGITALLVTVGTQVIDWYRQSDAAKHAEGDASALPAVLFMGLLTLYVATIPIIGFDLGSLLFLCLALYLQGEKRWWVMVGFSALVSGIIVLLFVKLLGIRLPTLLL
ncbi:tripartite tricarboxylate transporter TctB family protein [Billgrantia pellis]|uniref:Tripartite tricarboxylate transporter TctB family protein n=1 Tax=Billgrantia pellis TaxID=2606936 RepID=A0A7V7G0G4_9GAMM|nr:tripartite tricarboxylate transporter TctB family protein [Halomonas pellis]KAA0012915.1 tripartite tricarboxylate transporter TctB family protein [Halomonas pellis]